MRDSLEFSQNSPDYEVQADAPDDFPSRTAHDEKDPQKAFLTRKGRGGNPGLREAYLTRKKKQAARYRIKHSWLLRERRRMKAKLIKQEKQATEMAEKGVF